MAVNQFHCFVIISKDFILRIVFYCRLFLSRISPLALPTRPVLFSRLKRYLNYSPTFFSFFVAISPRLKYSINVLKWPHCSHDMTDNGYACQQDFNLTKLHWRDLIRQCLVVFTVIPEWCWEIVLRAFFIFQNVC